MNKEIIPLWKDEPDELYFEHKGLKCAIYRVEQLGHLCGYVGTREIVENADYLDVHGGVTFDQKYNDLQGWRDEYFIDCLQVIGFDGAHAGDLIPSMPIMGGTYRDMMYMRNEVVKLADQISKKLFIS